MNQIHLLYRLQQIDSEIRARKGRLREILDAQKQDRALREAKARAEEADAAHREASGKQRNLELELGSINTKAKQSEDRLYSGKVQNPKELADLQQSLASLRRRREMVEDQILETMLLVEETLAKKEETEQAYQEAEAAWGKKKGDLEAEQLEVATRLNELLEKRKVQAARIDRQAMQLYQETARQKGGVAVAGLQNDTCQVCSVRASAKKVRAARTGELVRCGSCGRFLAPI